MRIVVVESPAKSKTINKYLGSGYKVMASYGHIRDLRSKDGSVNPDDNFSMVWDISARGEKCIQDIVKNMKSCDELLLATDPDREGEAISWHIKEVLQERNKLTVPVKRIVFHEITKSAINAAIANPRDIDNSLVDAYLARRALDYLVGFNLSPILWRKMPGSKSAGRVQSVALRIIVDREVEIEAFKKQEYWSIEAQFQAPNKKLFDARLTHFNDQKLEKFSISNENDAIKIKEELQNTEYKVGAVEKKTVKRNPAPAFITSTLQQEASRKLGFSAKKTMQVAQKLYEGIDIGGSTIALITYMRTDSINLSQEAIAKIRGLIQQKYGNDFLPAKPRIYQTKVKNAQEAHEAIRPVDAEIIPEDIKDKIPSDLFKLYDLIWKRAVACQMASAEFDQVQVDIINSSGSTFRANGNTVKFEGFLKVYVEGKDDQQSDDAVEGLLPPLAQGDQTPLDKMDALQHFTSPPPRFSEASLVKKLEELGIGRPSTYATILQVLQDRGYVKLVKKFFVPEIRGRLVTVFLMNFFKKYLEYDFTANLEQALDDISNSSLSKQNVLSDFWTGLCENIAKTKDIKISDVIDKLNEELSSFLFTDTDGNISRKCPACGEGELSLKMGRYGSFIGCSRYPQCGHVKKLDSSPMTEEDNSMINASEYPKFLGVDPTDGQEVSLKKGPYGLYIQKNLPIPPGTKETIKPIRAAVPKKIDPASVDLNLALSLLPRMLGTYEGFEIKTGVGRLGPYVLYNGKFTAIPEPLSIATITLEEAINLIVNSRKKK